MSGSQGEESEAQCLEREAKQKEEADAAARAQFPPPQPPPMTQQNFMQYMQMMEERQRITLEQQNKFFQELLHHNRGERPENQGVTLLDFQNTKPISFAYAPEPMDAKDWLMDTERKLNTVGCTDEEKVRYATHLLCGPTASWWDNIVAVHPIGRVFTWEEFKRKFRESNVPESVMELKRREFENLEQKDKAILTYVKEFSGLSRYAADEVSTEDKRKKRFMRGLNPSFKMQLRMLRATEFQELVDAAITLEDDFKQVQEEKRKKAKFEPKKFISNKPNTNLTFKPRYNPSSNRRTTGFQFMANIICHTCGLKGHYSKDCRKPKVICFGCRQEGHMLKDCANRNNGGGKSGGGGSRNANSGGNWKNKKPFGKLNCTSLEEVINSDKAVIGKANVVADALSQKSAGGVEQELPTELKREISQAQIQLWEKEAHEGLSALQVAEELNMNLKNEIIMGQLDDPFIMEEIRRINEGRPSEFNLATKSIAVDHALGHTSSQQHSSRSSSRARTAAVAGTVREQHSMASILREGGMASDQSMKKKRGRGEHETYLENGVVGVSWRHSGTRLVTAAPGQDQAMATPSTIAPAHYQRALSTTTAPRSIRATSIAVDPATLAVVGGRG
ncbi:hypothetical protein QYE76_028088 [Lolium multiflorum]|uniref:CCHC-type domain-containing protein n=1 Tax=Lolium multiflorum TaxID=4521 RepID=A0AAD8VGY8_LOLMU|nr:hypothetical protein QYE76_028088 [Lolium multiflorum]